jgi:putative oxidoreductase
MKTALLNIGLFILRLSIGGMMLFNGMAKLLRGVDSIKETFLEVGIPEFIAYAVYLGEILAPILMIIGYRTRLAGLLTAITMLVAILTAHSEKIFTLNQYGGWALEVLGLYLFGALALCFTGAGKIAVSHSGKWD